jgi:hypothetical protein
VLNSVGEDPLNLNQKQLSPSDDEARTSFSRKSRGIRTPDNWVRGPIQVRTNLGNISLDV